MYRWLRTQLLATPVPLPSSRQRRGWYPLLAGSLALLVAANLVVLGAGRAFLEIDWCPESNPDPRWVRPPSTDRPFAARPPAVRLLGEAALECTLQDTAGHVVHLKNLVGRMPVVLEFCSFT